mgnify:CR=1 FL=1
MQGVEKRRKSQDFFEGLESFEEESDLESFDSLPSLLPLVSFESDFSDLDESPVEDLPP